MIKLKTILIPVIALGIVFSGAAYKIISVRALEGKIAPGPSQTVAIPKSEIHKGIEEVKANTPYKIKHPTVKIDDLKLVDTNSDKHTSQNKDIHVVYSFYKGDSNKELMIQQVDTTAKNPLTEETSGVQQIKLSDGTNAWVYDPSNGVGYIHIIFIKDNQSFDVMGSGLGKDRLINIASSLN